MNDTLQTLGRKAMLFSALFASALLGSACGGGSGLDSFKPGAAPAPEVQALEITTRTLPMGHVDESYGSQLAAAGATGPIQWTLADGELPAGMALAQTGTLSGMPIEAGLYPITVRARNGAQEDTQDLLLAVDTFGAVITDGLHYGDGWSGAPLVITPAGATGPVDFEILFDESHGHLSPDGTFVPGAGHTGRADVGVRVTDRNTGAHVDVMFGVQRHPTENHVARFGVSDVWYVDFALKRGGHPFATDAHACWAAIGMRGPSSFGTLGSTADQMADLLCRRAIHEHLNRCFLRNDDGTAGPEGLGISFCMERPDPQYGAPLPGATLPGAPTHYSILSVYDANSRPGFLGAAVIDDSANPNHVNNSDGSTAGELGIFLRTIVERVESGYRLAERRLALEPINDDDVPLLRALLYGEDVAGFGARGEDVQHVLWAVGRSVAAVAAHEIAHSCGLHHNETTVPGAIMNYSTTIHANADHFFLPHHLAALRNALPGPGRYGDLSKPGMSQTLAAQQAFLGQGLCVCTQ